MGVDCSQVILRGEYWGTAMSYSPDFECIYINEVTDEEVKRSMYYSMEELMTGGLNHESMHLILHKRIGLSVSELFDNVSRLVERELTSYPTIIKFIKKRIYILSVKFRILILQNKF
jgi:hypothetical protein